MKKTVKTVKKEYAIWIFVLLDRLDARKKLNIQKIFYFIPAKNFVSASLSHAAFCEIKKRISFSLYSLKWFTSVQILNPYGLQMPPCRWT